MKLFNLERGVIAGLLVFLVGLGIEIKITIDWMRNGLRAC